jgi:hypothetical protein
MNLRCAPIATATLVFALAVAAGRVTDVRIEGKFATDDVLTKGGKTYVPLSDVAKALGLTVQKTANGYDLVRAGGANQIEGVNGKTGDELFNGNYRFKVVKVIRTSSYKPLFSGGTEITPVQDADEIVAVVCRIKNGRKQANMVNIVGGDNTALTDQDGHSYAPYNGASIDMTERAPKLLPGAAFDFALTFEVPKSEKLKDLVFGVNDFTNKPGPDFRVSLQE